MYCKCSPRSLKNFVQSQEFLEQRRLNQVLREAQRTALAVKEEVRVTDALNYTLNLTSSNIRSVHLNGLFMILLYRLCQRKWLMARQRQSVSTRSAN